ncbi:cation diffusion facilitator CzcD-associated flavoprotein CzcO [Actinophytocola oryzae]|uniref:Cation diffusion facilitator CzcD-associated flavoprotein CzcO n=1 Tax=Actinophytocola oryzae TaxID=502181 RepID=A0A4R7VZI7_9PSEU|nr:cation diffusion facilitator CzcD-associated flavoprotein CzcO [Actinophytocola oryzae]
MLIVGAGLSGIGAACHLRTQCPDRTFTILEARDAIGGTWDLFRYPGVRSDSDMFTLGYQFNPWTDPKAIADGTSIREYVRRTSRKYDVDRRIRFHHTVTTASWSSSDARWTVTANRTDTASVVTLTCSFLYVCSGYYRYDKGYTPTIPGAEDFEGQVVHPQHWPADLDYTDKRIAVIGSGATAVTLVPAMADTAAHVTMVQRSPSYVMTLPGKDILAEKLQGRVPDRVLYPALRWKNVLTQMLAYQLSRHAPRLMRTLIRKGVLSQTPAGYDVDTHFAPKYAPWDQRMCFVPDGDLFTALRKGRATIVTGEIDRFTPAGLRMTTGEQVDADLVVTATGLNVQAVGGMTLTVDGTAIALGDTLAYKGMMLSGVPNFALTIGYTNASWTLKADLVATYVCRLLNHMAAHGYQVVTPVPADPGTDTEPIINLMSGYVLRSLDTLPKQGSAAPWRLHQNYPKDVLMLRRGPVDDEVRFDRVPETAREGTNHQPA